MKLQRDEDGPHVLVSAESFHEACVALAEAGIPFRDVTDEGTTCSGPVFAWLRFAADVDERLVEHALRELP